MTKLLTPEEFPDHFDGQGNKLTYEQRAARRAEIARKRADFELEAKKITEANRGTRNVFAEKLAEMEGREPVNAEEARSWKTTRKTLERHAKRRDAEIAEQQLAADYATSELVARVREHAGALERSWQITLPHADEADILELVALASTSTFSPEQLNAEFYSRLTAIEEKNLAAERLAESTTAVAAVKAEADHLRQQKTIAEREASLYEARQRAEGDE